MSAPTHPATDLEGRLKPLTARSVVLSLLLGAHPRGMTARELTLAGEYFGIAPTTVRVALTRAVAAGDLRREDANYRLGADLLARRLRQEDDTTAGPWDRTWEMAVVVVAGRGSSERAALRDALAAARLAELREGVWLRPANLRRVPPYATDPVLRTFRTEPDEDPVALAATLWDLAGWAREAHATLELFEATSEPAPRLTVAAHLVRHLTTDPLLPVELWPDGWPAPLLRRTYAEYQGELRSVTGT